MAEVEVFNLKTKKWRMIKNMTHRRNTHSMVVVNGKLTVFGGGQSVVNVEEYDGEKWDTIKALKENHYWSASVVVPTNRIQNKPT